MNILLAVTGSISAYKTPDIARGLINRGHSVRVVVSRGALEFINPEVFKYLGVEETYVPDSDFKSKGVLHIELANWLDSFVLCPATANTLSDLAHGKADTLLSSVFLSLSYEKVRLIFPAMNTQMYNNVFTRQNLSNLKRIDNLTIIEPDSGLLVCGTTGEGKLPKPDAVCELIEMHRGKSVNRYVMITAGATISNIDDVRFVTNPAKGGSAYLLAKKYLSEGWEVIVIKGANVIPEFEYLEKHNNYNSKTVITTQDLLSVVKSTWGIGVDVYISPMAVSDLEFDYAEGKLKKSDMKGTIKYKQAPDVLKWVMENKTSLQKVVGFGAEADTSDSVIKEKLKRKPVDLLVTNEVNSGLTGNNRKGFGTRSGNYKFSKRQEDGSYDMTEINDLDKKDLANYIFDSIKMR